MEANHASPEDGLVELYRAEHQMMVRLATLMVGSVAVAEEVVQDAFAVVGERWDQLSRPGGYLRQVVVNQCRQVLRRGVHETNAANLRQPALITRLPEHHIELYDALTVLTDRQRAVVVLRYFADIPDTEIAELLGARPSTVRSLARRALTALAKELE